MTSGFINVIFQSEESERLKMRVVRTKYVDGQLLYDGLEEIYVQVDKVCQCHCRIKKEVSVLWMHLSDVAVFGVQC